MKGIRTKTSWLAALAAAVLVATTALPAAAQLTADEIACPPNLGKATTKHVKTILKEVSKCKDNDLSGKVTGACPIAGDKIDKSEEKVLKSVTKKCTALCSVTKTRSCIAAVSCPPNGNSPELCFGKSEFRIGQLDFPGPFCNGIIGEALVDGDGLSQCMTGIGELVATDILDNVYGGLASSALADEKDAAKCVKGIAKAVAKGATSIAGTINKCRGAILSGKASGDPANCSTADPKTADKIDKTLDKVESTVEKCTDAAIALLDLCGNGVGGTTKADARTCLRDLTNEAAHGGADPGAGGRSASAQGGFVAVNIINAAYPGSAEATCGDNVVNQLPSQFNLTGEECDGTDNPCTEGCFPPGDAFECTCTETNRLARRADGPAADLSSGWTGNSHLSQVAQDAGYVSVITGCDCDGVTGATCTGSSSDPVCETSAPTAPKCSHDPFGDTCDDKGDGDGIHEDSDCPFCDDNSLNPGDFCANEGDCNSQCFTLATGLPTATPCVRNGDCDVATEVCLGRCDSTSECVITKNGAPLPLSAGGTPACIISTFRTDATGTSNIVTGEGEQNYILGSFTYLGISQFKPCPVCGGFCDDGNRQDEPCEGTCSTTTTTSCRFDSDCPGGETCTGNTPLCPGSFCNLELVCSGGANDGDPCRIEAETAFGTTSDDCPPDELQLLSPGGLTINFTPATSETVSHAGLKACSGGDNDGFSCASNGDCPGSFCIDLAGPCTDPGNELLTCFCPANKGGTTGSFSKPNSCKPACNAGAELGTGCATGPTGLLTGEHTRCAGGSNDGKVCDEPGDCPGGTCTDNPSHCTGDPATAQNPCSSNDDCGTGVCEDACPSGSCTLLCLGRGACKGDNEQAVCADNTDCGTGECVFDELGECAVGNRFICSDQTFLTCSRTDFEMNGAFPGIGCESGPDGFLGNADDAPGAGECIPVQNRCYLGDGEVEGGDTLNGFGDPTNWRSVSAYCIPPTVSSSVNITAGLGGPGRLRQTGVNVASYTELP